ncbi:MAG: DUF6607 family protein, partial [Pseudomonadota bacterium]
MTSRRYKAVLVGIVAALSLPSYSNDHGGKSTEPVEDQALRFTFSWPYAQSDDMKPRGGTTKGPEITLDHNDDRFQRLQAADIDKFERDRRAILAMSGPYRASFDFLETVGFVVPYERARPYQSWGTEYVYVVADEGDYIALQHVLVMFIQQEDGSLSAPMVVKHWRQDWRYQDRDIHSYQGHRRWGLQRLTRREAKGTWSQTVSQVDDSPRYESWGRWQHRTNHSSWESEETWRPLPRRESSVRNDYDVLVGVNRHTITPTGWIHEEDNLKVVLDAPGTFASEAPVLAREAGFNRYERLQDFDFSAGDDYLENTGPFWADVRAAWTRLYDRWDAFEMAKTVDGQPMFMTLFGHAMQLGPDAPYDAATGRAL